MNIELKDMPQSSLLVRLRELGETALRLPQSFVTQQDAIEALRAAIAANTVRPAPDGSFIVDAMHVLLADVLLMMVRDLRGGGERARLYQQIVGALIPDTSEDVVRLLAAQRNARSPEPERYSR